MKKPVVDEGTTISVVVPGLFDPETVATFPATERRWLETLLGRGDRIDPGNDSGFERTLFTLFNAEVPRDADLPVAAVTRVYDMGVIDSECWMRADPVHLMPRRDHVVMAPLGEVCLAQEEADALVEEVMAVFADDGWVLRAPHPNRWYLRATQDSDIQTTPLPDVVGHNIQPLLPSGVNATKWHTILNELQILLHTSRVNAEREARGVMPVNSLWFWGAGRLPALRDSPWARVWTPEPMAAALARLAQIPSGPCPVADVAGAIAGSGPGHHLVVHDRIYTARLMGDADEWYAATQDVIEGTIRPLTMALQRGALAAVNLFPCAGSGGYALTRGAARRWWRRRLRLEGSRP